MRNMSVDLILRKRHGRNKSTYFLKSAFLSQKQLVISFKIHNLEGNQMYFKNIGLHFAYLSNKLKKKIY